MKELKRDGCRERCPARYPRRDGAHPFAAPVHGRARLPTRRGRRAGAGIARRALLESPLGPAEIPLLIEVSDSTLDYDRDRKVPLYARHGIPEVWLFDRAAWQVTLYLELSVDRYRKILKPEVGVNVAPALLPELALDWAAVFEV